MPNDPYGGGWGMHSPASCASDEQQRLASLKRGEYALLRGHANRVGLCIMAFFVLQYALYFLLDLFDGVDAYENNAAFYHAISAVFFSFLSLFLPFFLLSLKKGSPRYIGVLPFSASSNRIKAALVVAAGFGVCMFSDIIAGYVSDLIQSVGLTEVDEGVRASVTPLDFSLNILCSAAAPALIEEYVFRGVIMQPLRRYGEHFAVWATAFVFGLAHGTVTSFAFAFPVGLVLGYAAVLTGSLWPGIIVHFLNNFYASVINDLYSVNPHLADTLGNTVVYIGLVLGAGALVFLAMSRSLRFEKSSAKALVKGKRFKGFFLSVPMLISVAAFLFFIVIVNLE